MDGDKSFIKRMAGTAAVMITSIFLAGAVSTLGVLEVNDMTSTASFCGSTCHAMTAYISDDPIYQNSAHRVNSSGVRADCKDCHLPKGFFKETFVHLSSGSRDMYSSMVNDFTDPTVWDAKVGVLAQKVRREMLSNDSANCRNCHQLEGMRPRLERAERQHTLAQRQGKTCIGCHFNLVHRPVPLDKEFFKLLNSNKLLNSSKIVNSNKSS